MIQDAAMVFFSSPRFPLAPPLAASRIEDFSHFSGCPGSLSALLAGMIAWLSAVALVIEHRSKAR
jgi:hypothetical protein